MCIYKETPFQYLRSKKTSELFNEKTVRNWYKARAFVIEKLNIAIKPKDNAHLHVVIIGSSPLMLSVARQVALSAHYINYDEENEDETKRNRSVITIVSQDPENTVTELRKEEYLCNLLDYCKWTQMDSAPVNKDSYIDVEIKITNKWNENVKEYESITIGEHTEYRFVFNEQSVETFCDTKTRKGAKIFQIDTRKAQFADRMYRLGSEIDNLPYEDIHSVARYTQALNVFQHIKLNDKVGSMVDANKWKDRDCQIQVLKALSNIFCADCFMTRYRSIMPEEKKEEKKEKQNKNQKKEIQNQEKQALGEHYLELSKSEHARWVVEKLILGYRPLSAEERLEESLIFNRDNRNQYRADLKNNWKSPAHIDLCSFADLRRVDPDNMKYDSFLMLGIPEILRKMGEIE